MPQSAVLSREDILNKVRDVLTEALGVDEEEVTETASLTRDLEAESIDFLDIGFRLEKTFSTPGRPFKIEQGELTPENLMDNPEWVVEGRLTDAGMKMLQERMPHVDFSEFDRNRDVNRVAEQITVGSIVEFVGRKLAR